MPIIARTTYAGTTPLALTVGVTVRGMSVEFSAGALTTTGDRGVPSRTRAKRAPDAVTLAADREYLGSLCEHLGALEIVVRSRRHRADPFPEIPAGYALLLGTTPFFQVVVPVGTTDLASVPVHVFEVRSGFPEEESFNVWPF